MDLWSNTATSRIKKENYRFYAVANIACIMSIFGHILLVALFWILDVRLMFFFNLFSCFLWLLCFFINKHGYHRTAMALGYIEIIVHAALSVMTVGWGFGFHVYIICLAPIIYFIPTRSTLLRIVLTVLVALSYLGLIWFSSLVSPQYKIEPAVENFMNYYNTIFLFIALAMLAFYYSKAAKEAEAALELEYQRSESLLLNILPQPVAKRLKDAGGSAIIADEFRQVTVVFADIVGFTKLCATMPAEETVQMLNTIFSSFDSLVEKYGVEKIKTIGDNYMLAAGLPVPSEDHATAAAGIALEMIQSLKKLNQTIHKELNIRIGLHSGPVVAGVIGTRKFIYDLWGDTVNTASRMESHGQPGRVHCSEVTAKLLEKSYLLEERGAVEIKGKGMMTTYFIQGVKNS